MQDAINNRQPGHAEGLAAVAAMTETYGWMPSPGDRVRCPQAFGGGYQSGTVCGRDRMDDAWLVDTPEGRLLMFTRELEPIKD